jgi:hypothetical protein
MGEIGERAAANPPEQNRMQRRSAGRGGEYDSDQDRGRDVGEVQVNRMAQAIEGEQRRPALADQQPSQERDPDRKVSNRGGAQGTLAPRSSVKSTKADAHIGDRGGDSETTQQEP